MANKLLWLSFIQCLASLITKGWDPSHTHEPKKRQIKKTHSFCIFAKFLCAYHHSEIHIKNKSKTLLVSLTLISLDSSIM